MDVGTISIVLVLGLVLVSAAYTLALSLGAATVVGLVVAVVV